MCHQVSATETCTGLRDLSTLIIIDPEEMELGIPGLIFFNVKIKIRKDEGLVVFSQN